MSRNGQVRALEQVDPELAEILVREEERQRTTLALIASENYASVAVRQVSGSILTNKYSEGYPRRRYYGGNQLVDAAESLAIERAKHLFGAEHANVQPHAGSQANMAAYFALLDPGDTVLSMELAQGGHLSHGMSANFSGKIYRFVHTDNHLFLFDLTPLGIDGQQASERAEAAALIVNKNLIPYDPLPATKASGLRVGTACATTRGLGTSEMDEVADFLYRAVTTSEDTALARIASEVADVLDDFPAPFLTALAPVGA